jgi:hypothetical protein
VPSVRIFYGMWLVLDHEWAAKVVGNPSDLALAHQNQPDICTALAHADSWFPGKRIRVVWPEPLNEKPNVTRPRFKLRTLRSKFWHSATIPLRSPGIDTQITRNLNIKAKGREQFWPKRAICVVQGKTWITDRISLILGSIKCFPISFDTFIKDTLGGSLNYQ